MTMRAALLTAFWARTAFAAFDAKDTRILDFSWDTPSAPILASQVKSHQHLPIDGVVTDLLQNNPTYGYGDPRDLFAWKTWSTASVNAATFSQATGALQGASHGRFNSNLLRFNVAGQHVDWFNSASVIANAQLASSIMAQGGFKGILLDTEYYPNVSPGTPFDYNTQPQKASHTFAQYKTQARAVGGQFIAALKSLNPDAQVMLTYGYRTAGTNQANWQNEPYGLLPAFIDGMLDGAGPNNLIIDGWENGYGYNSTAQYDSAYQTMRVSNASLSANPTGFASNARASFGFWLDRGPNGQSTVWDPVNIANNQYSPAQFQFAIQEAAKRSDKYVWLHSEIAGFWNDNIPKPYIDALKSVRKTGALERFAGTTKDTSGWQSHVEQSGVITQNNALTIDAVSAFSASQADYTTKTMTVGIGGLVSVEVTNLTSTANSGFAQNAKVGLILSNDSGGAGASALLDSRSVSILWSNNDNAILTGVSDPVGLNRNTTLASMDHPTNANWIYQIERLSASSAKLSVMDSTGGALISTPQIVNFSGMPADLFISLFAQAGDATFKNVWVAAAVYSGWGVNGSGDWHDADNWSTTYVPNAVDAKALLGGAIDAKRTVYADSAIALGSLKFDNANGYQISGQGSLSFDVSSGTATIDVLQGSHKINLPLFINDNTTANIQAGGKLTIGNPMTLVAGAMLNKIGAGTLSIEAPVYTTAGAAIASAAGVTSVSTDLGEKVSVTVTGGTVQFNRSQHLSSVDVSGGVLTVGSSLMVTQSLSLSGAGQIDLQSGRFIVDYNDNSPLVGLADAIDSGALGTTQLLAGAAIAVGEAADLFGSSGGTYAGYPVDASAVLIAYTFAGDATLDGSVDSTDFNVFLSGYGEVSGARWTQGDFNRDGNVNTLDSNSLAGNFGLTMPAAGPLLGAVVPEPSMAGIIAPGALSFVRRNRRI